MQKQLFKNLSSKLPEEFPHLTFCDTYKEGNSTNRYNRAAEHYVLGSGRSSSDAELSFVNCATDCMMRCVCMVSPSIVVSIVSVGVSMTVSMRHLGWHSMAPTTPAPVTRVRSFPLPTRVASRSVCSLNKIVSK